MRASCCSGWAPSRPCGGRAKRTDSPVSRRGKHKRVVRETENTAHVVLPGTAVNQTTAVSRTYSMIHRYARRPAFTTMNGAHALATRSRSGSGLGRAPSATKNRQREAARAARGKVRCTKKRVAVSGKGLRVPLLSNDFQITREVQTGVYKFAVRRRRPPPRTGDNGHRGDKPGLTFPWAHRLSRTFTMPSFACLLQNSAFLVPAIP